MPHLEFPFAEKTSSVHSVAASRMQWNRMFDLIHRKKKNGAALSDRAAHISTANCLSYWLPADSRLASHLRERLLPLRLVVLLVPVIVSVATVPEYSIFMLFVP